jgi:hypothetical protein
MNDENWGKKENFKMLVKRNKSATETFNLLSVVKKAADLEALKEISQNDIRSRFRILESTVWGDD